MPYCCKGAYERTRDPNHNAPRSVSRAARRARTRARTRRITTRTVTSAFAAGVFAPPVANARRYIRSKPHTTSVSRVVRSHRTASIHRSIDRASSSSSSSSSTVASSSAARAYAYHRIAPRTVSPERDVACVANRRSIARALLPRARPLSRSTAIDRRPRPNDRLTPSIDSSIDRAMSSID